MKPLRDRDADTLDKIRVALHSRNTTEIIVDRRVALEAATVRAATDIKLPDAIIVATAVISGCDALIGNDKTCARRVTEIPYIYLDEVVKA